MERFVSLGSVKVGSQVHRHRLRCFVAKELQNRHLSSEILANRVLKRSGHLMFNKIFNFDVSRLNFLGWALFLFTAMLDLAIAFLIAADRDGVAKLILQNGITMTIFGLAEILLLSGSFVAVRNFLELLGLSIFKESEQAADSKTEPSPHAGRVLAVRGATLGK